MSCSRFFQSCAYDVLSVNHGFIWRFELYLELRLIHEIKVDDFGMLVTREMLSVSYYIIETNRLVAPSYTIGPLALFNR